MTWKINLLTTTLEQISELIRVICAYIQIWHNEGVKWKKKCKYKCNYRICKKKEVNKFYDLWNENAKYIFSFMISQDKLLYLGIPSDPLIIFSDDLQKKMVTYPQRQKRFHVACCFCREMLHHWTKSVN